MNRIKLSDVVKKSNVSRTIEFGKMDIPDQMLLDTENDPMLGGVVLSRKGRQVSISDEGKLIGFLTPRKERDGSWRTGAIYIDKKYRSMGYGSSAIYAFFSDKEKGYALIEPDNYASQKAFEKAGFKQTGSFLDKTDNVNYQIWKK